MSPTDARIRVNRFFKPKENQKIGKKSLKENLADFKNIFQNQFLLKPFVSKMILQKKTK